MRKTALTLAALTLLAGCSVQDSRLAQRAQTRLLGLPEVDLVSCLGAPDQNATYGTTRVLTYYAGSTSSSNFSLPVVGGVGFSNGGYCHATVQLQNGRVSQILYSGEKNAAFAPDAYCAPILRTCLQHLDQTPPGPS